jgi:hypothetical protein
VLLRRSLRLSADWDWVCSACRRRGPRGDAPVTGLREEGHSELGASTSRVPFRSSTMSWPAEGQIENQQRQPPARETTRQPPRCACLRVDQHPPTVNAAASESPLDADVDLRHAQHPHLPPPDFRNCQLPRIHRELGRHQSCDTWIILTQHNNGDSRPPTPQMPTESERR